MPMHVTELHNKFVCHQVAQNDQLTYTDLVRQLTETLVSDLEKARFVLTLGYYML